MVISVFVRILMTICASTGSYKRLFLSEKFSVSDFVLFYNATYESIMEVLFIT